ncbi:MAG: undecaprenyldiphospho-muramoylpentapeptide beta-N-acetylglucosaminyltransferase [Spirochaetes bacterium RIFOXYC1_FULL_54_7]|nr:MAG: undecaprenyldiphospho-muramoylpentapeptide beta-N-acetylglucosaminyltransferase [Spirochaetes bacterium RIFOXYC1_FULL_54_7]
MNNGKSCIAFTGGGTGGHVYPGLAVIEKLRESYDGRIVWIGSGKAVERQAVESAGVEFLSIPTGKLRRSLSLENLVDVFRVIAGFFYARGILKKLGPVLLFSKGGYVSVPPCLAAASLGIPFYTHESDLSPGLATRINARRASHIFLGWEKTFEMIPEAWKARTSVSGNPVRASITKGNPAAGRAWLGFDKDLPIILVLGGSQGARQINELVAALLPRLEKTARTAHQTGPDNAPCRPDDASYKGFEFVNSELPDLMAAADLVIGRAGAGTIAECAAAGKPMVLVPLTGATRGDQVENARLLEREGAAMVFEGAEASPEAVLAALKPLLEDEGRRSTMAAAARKVTGGNAADIIASTILQHIKGGI